MTGQEKYYPPAGFHFRVVFSGIGKSDIDSRFQSVSGLNVELETESRKEGGENRYEHVLPVRAKYPVLVLKRGLVSDSGLLTEWCANAFQSLVVRPVDLTVTLLNENHEPLMTWSVRHAWPRKWSHSDLNAEQSALAIETFELQYHYFTLL
ncbi:MAG: phage tail protein [Chlorobiaceae bacterium]|jgi:phage tail-like protein|nr:phage tail protein [Chlorobiaceae bacterium]